MNSPRSAQPRRWLWASGAAALASVAVAFAVTREEPSALEITSAPSGASISLDGEAIEAVTPAVLDALAPGEHSIEVHAPGMRPWTRRVTLVAGAPTQVHAALEPLEPDTDDGPPPPAEPAADPESPDAEPLTLREGRHLLRLLPERHAFSVPEAQAARLELDPRHTYRLRVHGTVYLDDASGSFTRSLSYYLHGPALAPSDTFGVVEDTPRLVGGASALYAFVLDDHPEDNRGELTLEVEDLDGQGTQRLVIDPRTHVVIPRRGSAVTGLSPTLTYEVTARAGSPVATTRSSDSAPVERALLVRRTRQRSEGVDLAASTAQSPRLIAVGRRTLVSGADELLFTLPDDRLDDNAGALELEITLHEPFEDQSEDDLEEPADPPDTPE